MSVPSPRAAAEWLAGAIGRASRRTIGDAWPLLQATAAATTAWVIARYLFGWHDPFFAPIAALIALNSSVGERGLNAVRLLQGVVLGIVAGELTLVTLGGGFGSMAIAVFAATALARGFGGQRIVVAQAAVGAILTIAIADGVAGIERLRDALVGAGVALLFTQVLFSPEPLSLLRRAEMTLLQRIAQGATLTARALEEEDAALAQRAIDLFRGLPDQLGELRRVRSASARVARRTLVWRSRRQLVVDENENADHLDLLAASGLAMARSVRPLSRSDHRPIAPRVRVLADALTALADDLGDRQTRQEAADRAFRVATIATPREIGTDSALGSAVAAIRIFAVDVIVFAGVELDVVLAAVRRGTLEHQVRPPVADRGGLFGWARSRLRRLWKRARGRG